MSNDYRVRPKGQLDENTGHKIEWYANAESPRDALTLIWGEIEKHPQMHDAVKAIKKSGIQSWAQFFNLEVKRNEKWEQAKKPGNFFVEKPVGSVFYPQQTREDIQKSVEAARRKKEEANKGNASTAAPPKDPEKPKDQTNEELKPIHDMFHDDHGNLLPWENRWALADNNKRELENNNTLKYTNERLPDREALDQRYKDKEAAWEKVDRGDFFAIGEAILKELEFGVQYVGTYISYIPRDINDGLKMMSADLTMLSLSVERIINIIGEIWNIISKLNSIGAFDLLEKYVKSVNETLENGIKEGILEKDGNLKQGFTQFAVPGVSGVNTPEELRKILTLKELAESPIFGRQIRKTLEIEMMANYQSRTGVGFPDEYSATKWILGNSGAYMPIQQVSEIAGTIPEWWLIGKTQKLAKEIKESERRELEKQRKDFYERQTKQKERLDNIKPYKPHGHPWVKR